MKNVESKLPEEFVERARRHIREMEDEAREAGARDGKEWFVQLQDDHMKDGLRLVGRLHSAQQDGDGAPSNLLQGDDSYPLVEQWVPDHYGPEEIEAYFEGFAEGAISMWQKV